MDNKEFLSQLNSHLSHLYSFAKQVNELDFAMALSGEFRGLQDAGWSTTITANEVSEELSSMLAKRMQISRSEMRIILMLYCQLSEAGGVYEGLKNIIGVLTLKPYILWPFKDLVRTRESPRRVIGPNANATFRNLAESAKSIGMSQLSILLESAFRDDVRNGVSHADYVIWDDGFRLCNRNGGYGARLSFLEINQEITRGSEFFQILQMYNQMHIMSYNTETTIVGRLSENPAMQWKVHWDQCTGAFEMKSSSVGIAATPEYNRQVSINERLGGRVFSTYSTAESKDFDDYILNKGFEPNKVVLDERQMSALSEEIDGLKLWDNNSDNGSKGDLLLVSPRGFRWLRRPNDFDNVLASPLLELDFG